MSDPPRPPVPPPSPTDSGGDGAPRRERVTVGVTLLLFLGLAGWQLWGDRTRPRPTELKREAVAHTIDLNRATRIELSQLPGVGPAMAEKILNHRELNGPFRKLDDLKGISGVGPATFAKLSPHFSVTVDEAPEEPRPEADPEPLRLTRKTEAKQEPVIHNVQKPILDGLIDINNAPLKDLEKLPGIGPVLAKRIAEARDRQPMTKWEDLRKISGIGVKKAEALRDSVKFGPRADHE